MSTNLNFIDLYTFGKGLFDLLRAPSCGVAARDLAPSRERAASASTARSSTGEAGSRRHRVAAALDGVLARAVGPAVFDRTLSTLYERWSDAPLDHLAIDLYDPFTAQQSRRADGLLSLLTEGVSARALAGLDLSAIRLAEPWEWSAEPWALVRNVRTLTWPLPRLPD